MIANHSCHAIVPNQSYGPVGDYFSASAIITLMSSPLVLSTYGQASPSVFSTKA